MDSEYQLVANPNVGSLHDSSDQPKEPVFELLKEVGEDVWIAIRRDDPRGEQFLASPSPFASRRDEDADNSDQDRREVKARQQLLSKHNQAYTIRQILNHENLISIVGSLDRQTFTKTQKRDDAEPNTTHYLVWDFCDAGNLSSLFREHPRQDSSYYLPESLCWHVLCSLTRAVTYLHDGKRLYFHSDPEENWKEFVSVDMDWFPILHRAIEPKNIFFQHPRGTETFGQCKLGGFSNAAATCHAMHDLEDYWYPEMEAHSMALSTWEGTEPLSNTRKTFKDNPETIRRESRVYTLADELRSIGVVIFTMMTGYAPTYCCDECGCSHVYFCKSGGCLEDDATCYKACQCVLGGCKHLSKDACEHETTRWTPCPPEHHCSEPNINIHSYMARARYTKILRSIIQDLLLHDPQRRQKPIPRAVEFAKVVEDAYKEWKYDTEEGAEYTDIGDDMTKRWRKAHRDSLPEEEDQYTNGYDI
ncbi:hypothetical protein FDECE_178 [Fusarium decemcellulare]|nr:hypothetical protein FDECE_178 [Fusarium decemcellulare]